MPSGFESKHRLTAAQIEAARASADGAMLTLNDGAGLRLLIDPRRGSGWRFRYRVDGKDALLSLGPYPKVSLEEARKRAADARAKLARGESPAEARRRERTETVLAASKTFGVVAAEYLDKRRLSLSAATIERYECMYRHSQRLHNRQFSQIDRPEILGVIRTALENAGKHDSAHRLGQFISGVYRYALDEGYFKGVNPCGEGFGKSLKPVRTLHRPALTDPSAVGGLMRNIDSWSFHQVMGPVVGPALQVLARTAVRPGELRHAEWSEMDLDGSRHGGKPTWVIPLRKMKMKDGNRSDHVVPLSRQTVEILRELHGRTGAGPYVFPHARADRAPLTLESLGAAMIGLGYKDEHCPHGFRGTFATLARDVLKSESEIVELQLAHRVGNDVRAAYDRASRLDERRDLMQRYSDLLDKLREGGKV